MTFQLYGIIPIPAWLVVSGIFAYDSYSTIKGTVSRLLVDSAPTYVIPNLHQSGTTDSVGHIGGLLTGVGYFFARRYRIF